MAGLDAIGISGPTYLREALTNCSDPLKAIEDFQQDNSILLPSLRPMLPLLDLHGVPRLEFHQTVMEELREQLVKKINELAPKEGRERDRKLKELLLKTFPVIKHKQLRPVVMCILKHIHKVEDKYLQALVNDKELYADTPTEVKRQIWENNQALFGDEVSPLFGHYIKEKEAVLFNHETGTNPAFFNLLPKARRQGGVVQKLVHMCGKNVKLYDITLQFLRTLFLRTRNVHYCTLRCELLMTFHDTDVQEVTNVDPCHKFTWCLDACIREMNVEVKRSRELQGFLDSIKRGQEQVLGDLSMVLCDPYAVNFLASSALRILQILINSESLARENTVLMLLLRMLNIGLHAWEMIDASMFKEPKLDSNIITRFTPALMSLIVDDQARALTAKLPSNDRQTALTTIEHSGPPPDAIQAFIQESRVASVLAMYYALHVAKNKDRQGLMRILGPLATCENDRAFEDPFLHSLVFLLTNMADEFATEDFCTVVFDEFFFTSVSRENVLRHLLNLLWSVHTKLPPTRLSLLMKALQPATQHCESVHTMYQNLQAKVNTQQGSPEDPHPPESLESPLINVPTPSSL